MPKSDDETAKEAREHTPKFMVTMAYPYMNGVLHAGHSFTLSKVEFAVGFEKMRGKRTLFPLGFHCTGMPIRACADKLAREAKLFGKDYSDVPDDNESELLEQQREKMRSEDGSVKFKGKKTKATAKQGRVKYQFEIMLQLGIERKDLYKFANPAHWLKYFPPLCQRDCESFGARIDWRRSMITTDMNPYYDQFIRWQVQRLKDVGRIKFGERYTIYSVKDGQPCMDHDRQSGEGVTPQEYVGVKIEVIEFSDPSVVKKLDISKKVYLIAATLRAETMYGQTCCFVSPDILYGIFDNGDSYYITTKRAYKNMSFQKLTLGRGVYKHVAVVQGSQLIGSKIHCPLSYYETLWVLPMDTILSVKGTGIVACVPSDSPDDFITCQELKQKPERYGVLSEWVLNPVSIINTKLYGDQCAPQICQEFKIKSPRETDKLAKAKECAYKEGYNNGTMLVGEYVGQRVEIAKPKVRQDLINNGLAFIYSEPESPVISRSGDICVVSLEDQWYVDYGEAEWKSQALEALAAMKNMNQTTVNAFESVLEWLKNWAVCRTYGLGTRLPWDEKYLVESLSDSTIYQAYYTICHLLHSDVYGSELGELGITAEQMTPDVFDYVFLHRDEIVTDIPLKYLNRMRREFEYFYPLDMSISGKDLIPNHLTFFIYTHTAIFPKEFWPRGIRANGHLLLNNNKMSKSTGNFLTLQDVINKFGADASRIALADAGDTVDDANFEESTANSAVLRLHTLKEWCEEVKSGNIPMRLTNEQDDSWFDSSICEETMDPNGYSLLDRCFDNEMNVLIHETYEHYSNTNYKMALRSGFFDFQALRDFYRDIIDVMHEDLVMKYIELQALLLTPIAPHIADFIWREILQHETSIQEESFPLINRDRDINTTMSIRLGYIRSLLRQIREVECSKLRKRKNGTGEIDGQKPVKMTVFIALDFPEWKVKYMKTAKMLYEEGRLSELDNVKRLVSGDLQRAMPYIMHLQQRLETESPYVVFNHEIEYEEERMIEEIMDKVLNAPQFVEVDRLEIIHFRHADGYVKMKEGEMKPIQKPIEKTIPGEPTVMMDNC